MGCSAGHGGVPAASRVSKPTVAWGSDAPLPREEEEQARTKEIRCQPKAEPAVQGEPSGASDDTHASSRSPVLLQRRNSSSEGSYVNPLKTSDALKCPSSDPACDKLAACRVVQPTPQFDAPEPPEVGPPQLALDPRDMNHPQLAPTPSEVQPPLLKPRACLEASNDSAPLPLPLPLPLPSAMGPPPKPPETSPTIMPTSEKMDPSDVLSAQARLPLSPTYAAQDMASLTEAAAPNISQSAGRLRVAILHVDGLPVSASGSTCCSCHVVGKPNLCFQTKHVRNTMALEWGEEHEFMNYNRGDSLYFKVLQSLNRDTWRGASSARKKSESIGSGVCLGWATLDGKVLDMPNGFAGRLQLNASIPTSSATLRVQVELSPRMAEMHCFPFMGSTLKESRTLPRATLLQSRTTNAGPISMPGSRLLVRIKGASGIQCVAGSLDPFCSCCLVEKPESSFKTGPWIASGRNEGGTNPAWCEEHEFDDYDFGDSLRVKLMNFCVDAPNNVLGSVVLPSRDFDHANGFDEYLWLEDSSYGAAIKLNLRVEILPPATPYSPPVSEPGSSIHVKIMSAAFERSVADFILASESAHYCECQIVGKPDSLAQTRPLAKAPCLTWEEDHEIDMFEQGDLLEFRLMDISKTSHVKLLGSTKLGCWEFDRVHGFNGELKIRQCGKGCKVILRVQVSVLPPVAQSAPPISEPGSTLWVAVLSASGLRPADEFSRQTSSPYCCCQLRGKPNTAFQTQHSDSIQAPNWCEEHVVQGYDFRDYLEFRVCDFQTQRLLGKASLAWQQFDHEKGFQGAVPLKALAASTTAPGAFLEVSVRVLPPAAATEGLVEAAQEMPAGEQVAPEIVAEEQVAPEAVAEEQAAPEAAEEKRSRVHLEQRLEMKERLDMAKEEAATRTLLRLEWEEIARKVERHADEERDKHQSATDFSSPQGDESRSMYNSLAAQTPAARRLQRHGLQSKPWKKK